MKLKLEIEFEEGSKTCVEKEFDGFYAGSQFDTVLNELAGALICCGISKSYVDENIDYIDNPKNEEHVSCTKCFHWDELSNYMNNFETTDRVSMPEKCLTCYPYESEEWLPLSIRKNYSKL